MSKGYLAIAFLIAHTHASAFSHDKCDYVCDVKGCRTSVNHFNNEVPTLKYCTKEDIPKDINFILKDEAPKFPARLQINFKPPRRMCKYEMSLLANESVNEKACANYHFHNFNGSETHTPKIIVCFVSNDSQNQNSIDIPFQYIFTACYAVQFYLGKGQFIHVNKFLKTNYNRTEVTKPIFKCSHSNIPNNKTDKNVAVFNVNFSTPVINQAILKLGLSLNVGGQKICDWNNAAVKDYKWTLNISEYIKNKHGNFHTSLATSDRYETEMNFQTKTLQNTSYCFLIFLYDIRCKENTLWEPPENTYRMCSWKIDCPLISKQAYPIPINSYLLSSITIITLSMFIILGIMYLVYIMRTCNIQHEKFDTDTHKNYITKTKHIKCNNSTNEKNVKCENSAINRDIVLLYPKSSEPFMALMADFRGILSKVCQCLVHDWYERTEWNYVAEIGGSDWFAEMLYKESRVVWIDTPNMRSLITRKFKKDVCMKGSEQNDFVEIRDFRDILFPVIFNLAKRNIEESLVQQHKHFVIRLKGFEGFENEDDPFVPLSLHTRYLLPQDLNLLCSELSASESDVIIPFMRQGEDLIKQHLYHADYDFHK